MNEASKQSSTEQILSGITYALSIPERLIRASVGIAGGIVKELSERLVPRALQETQLFQTFVARGNRFVLERLAGVEGVYEAEKEEEQGSGSEEASRMVVSNLIDVGSLMTIHLSPLLVLAAASDVLKGSHHYLDRLVEDLKAEGVIEADANIDDLQSFIIGIQAFSEQLAVKAELPPLSKEELIALAQDVRKHVEDLESKHLLNHQQLEHLMEHMHDVAAKQDRSVWDIGMAMAQGSATALVKSAQGLVCAAESGLHLLDDHIIEFYNEQLTLLEDEGYVAYVNRVSVPYYQAMLKSWHTDNYTWTEAFLHGLTQQ